MDYFGLYKVGMEEKGDIIEQRKQQKGCEHLQIQRCRPKKLTKHLKKQNNNNFKLNILCQ